ncbi:hypothetical protein L218DRAFT_813075, partial [Marasmius fiardii PR-910]
CEPCIHSKQHCHNILQGPSICRSKPLELIHTDLKGPLPTASLEGYWYWMTFIDN